MTEPAQQAPPPYARAKWEPGRDTTPILVGTTYTSSVKSWDLFSRNGINTTWVQVMIKCAEARLFPVSVVQAIEYGEVKDDEGEPVTWHEDRRPDDNVVRVMLTATCLPGVVSVHAW